MHTGKVFSCLVGLIAAIFVTTANPLEANAGRCNITCEKSSCGTSAWFRRVHCICGSDGYARCGTGPSPSKRAADDGAILYAGVDELRALEDHIVRAYDLGLYDVGDAAAAMYDGIVRGELGLFEAAEAEHSGALTEVPDDLWEQLDAAQ